MTTFINNISLLNRLKDLTGQNHWDLDQNSYQNLAIGSLIQKKEFQDKVSTQLASLTAVNLTQGNLKTDLIYQAAVKKLHEAGIFLSFLFIVEAKTLSLKDTKQKNREPLKPFDLLKTTLETKVKFQELFQSLVSYSPDVSEAGISLFEKLFLKTDKTQDDVIFQLSSLYLLIGSGVTIQEAYLNLDKDHPCIEALKTVKELIKPKILKASFNHLAHAVTRTNTRESLWEISLYWLVILLLLELLILAIIF